MDSMVQRMVIATVKHIPDELVRNINENIGGFATVGNVPQPAFRDLGLVFNFENSDLLPSGPNFLAS